MTKFISIFTSWKVLALRRWMPLIRQQHSSVTLFFCFLGFLYSIKSWHGFPLLLTPTCLCLALYLMFGTPQSHSQFLKIRTWPQLSLKGPKSLRYNTCMLYAWSTMKWYIKNLLWWRSGAVKEALQRQGLYKRSWEKN